MSHQPVTLLNPYQKFGTDVTGMTTEAALKHAGMAGWNQRLFIPDVPGIKSDIALIVADIPSGPRVLGAVTTKYRPIQIEEAFTPLMDGLNDQGLKPQYVGAYNDGRDAYITFTVPESNRTLPGGDRIESQLLITKGNDGHGGILGYPTSQRAMCANMIHSIKKHNKRVISIRHTSGADPYVAQQAEVLLGITQNWADEITKFAAGLDRTKVTRKRWTDVIVPAILGDRPEDQGRSQTYYDRQFAELMEAWTYPTMDHLKQTGWRAYNALTEWEQHHRTGNELTMAQAAIKGSTRTNVLLELVG